MQLRWEKYAPGPVRKVVVHEGRDPDGPAPKRGRPPKRRPEEVDEKKNGDEKGPDGQGDLPDELPKAVREEDAFVRRSKQRSVVVPPEDVPVVSPKDAPPLEPKPWPTRVTFAGRKMGKGEDESGPFQSRRMKFYSCIPSEWWKDGHERTFWKLCCENDGDLDKAISAFQSEKGITPPPPTSSQASSSRRAKARCVKKVLPEEPGRKHKPGRRAA